jgi:hypothetical protein
VGCRCEFDTSASGGRVTKSRRNLLKFLAVVPAAMYQPVRAAQPPGLSATAAIRRLCRGVFESPAQKMWRAHTNPNITVNDRI